MREREREKNDVAQWLFTFLVEPFRSNRTDFYFSEFIIIYAVGKCKNETLQVYIDALAFYLQVAIT